MQPQQHRNSAHASITSFSPKRAFIRTGNAVMSQLKGSQDVALLLPSHCRIPGSPGRPRLRQTEPPSPIDLPRLLLPRGPPPRPSLGTHIPVSSHWNALLKGRRSTFNPAPAIQHDAQRAPVRTRPSRLGDAAGPKLKSLLKGTVPTGRMDTGPVLALHLGSPRKELKPSRPRFTHLPNGVNHDT